VGRRKVTYRENAAPTRSLSTLFWDFLLFLYQMSHKSSTTKSLRTFNSGKFVPWIVVTKIVKISAAVTVMRSINAHWRNVPRSCRSSRRYIASSIARVPTRLDAYNWLSEPLPSFRFRFRFRALPTNHVIEHDTATPPRAAAAADVAINDADWS